MRRVLSLRGKATPSKMESHAGQGVASIIADIADQLVLNSVEAAEAQRFSAALWAARNEWSVRRARERSEMRRGLFNE